MALDLTPRPGVASLELPDLMPVERAALRGADRVAGTITAIGRLRDDRCTYCLSYLTLENGTPVSDHLWVKLRRRGPWQIGERVWVTGEVTRYWNNRLGRYALSFKAAQLSGPRFPAPPVGIWVYWLRRHPGTERHRFSFPLPPISAPAPQPEPAPGFWQRLIQGLMFRPKQRRMETTSR